MKPQTEKIKTANRKVFEFSKNGKSYTIQSASKEDARRFLKEEHGVDIKNCFEIPESEWDKPRITVYEDNDIENESFLISIREALNENGTEIVCTNDNDILD